MSCMLCMYMLFICMLCMYMLCKCIKPHHTHAVKAERRHVKPHMPCKDLFAAANQPHGRTPALPSMSQLLGWLVVSHTIPYPPVSSFLAPCSVQNHCTTLDLQLLICIFSFCHTIVLQSQEKVVTRTQDEALAMIQVRVVPQS